MCRPSLCLPAGWLPLSRLSVVGCPLRSAPCPTPQFAFSLRLQSLSALPLLFLQGVADAAVPGLVSALLQKLTLAQYADRPCGGYSGQHCFHALCSAFGFTRRSLSWASLLKGLLGLGTGCSRSGPRCCPCASSTSLAARALLDRVCRRQQAQAVAGYRACWRPVHRFPGRTLHGRSLGAMLCLAEDTVVSP